MNGVRVQSRALRDGPRLRLDRARGRGCPGLTLRNPYHRQSRHRPARASYPASFRGGRASTGKGTRRIGGPGPNRAIAAGKRIQIVKRYITFRNAISPTLSMNMIYGTDISFLRRRSVSFRKSDSKKWSSGIMIPTRLQRQAEGKIAA
jgi:hypothetical protein